MAKKKKNEDPAQMPDQNALAPIEEPKIEEIIECPPELNGIARQEWDRVAPLLTDKNRLTALDRAPLAVYCTAYAAWLEAQMALQTYGTVMKSPNGHPIQSPYVSIANKNAEIILRIASEFGFTPTSRRQFPGGSQGNSLLLDIPGFEYLFPNAKR